MSFAAEDFRQNFPEFADPQRYSNFLINFQITSVAGLLDAGRWGTLLDYGSQLYVAHLLVLARRSALASAAGGVPGTPTGLLTSKSIDKVSASYDVTATMADGAGFFNATTYGQMLWGIMRRMGAGPLQVGVGAPMYDTNFVFNGQFPPTGYYG